MPHPAWQSKSIANFGGPTKNALRAENVRYFYAESGVDGMAQCKVRTRAGHSVAFNPAAAIRRMHNFVATDPVFSTPHNFLFYYDGTELKAFNLLNSTGNSMNPPVLFSALKFSAAEAGTFCYIADFDQNGIGVDGGYVIDTNLNADPLFLAPPTTAQVTISLAETVAAGPVTAGTHKALFVLSTRNGRTCPPGPTATGVVVPATIVASGGHSLIATVSGTFPASSMSVQIIMSPVNDVDTYYFVANTTFAVNGGPHSLSIPIDIGDPALINSVPAAPYFNQIVAGLFNPSFVVFYRNRMVYGAGDRIYISDPFNYQWITADQNVQFVPGLQTIIGAFPYRDGNLYVVTRESTFAFTDNGDVPSSWAAAQATDMRIGTPAPLGFTNDPTRNEAWVATPSTLRLFQDGSYQERGMAFWIPDWQRINWASAATIEVIDVIEDQTIKILAPLDGATSPSHVMSFNYMSGKTPELVRYSLEVIPNRQCMERVLNPSTARQESWLGPAAGADGKVWKRDASLTQDLGVDIAGQIYETSPHLAVNELNGPISFHGAHYTARGTARLQMTPYSLRHRLSAPPKTTDLATVPNGVRIYRQWLLNVENQSLEFRADSGWFELTECQPYYTPWVRQR